MQLRPIRLDPRSIREAVFYAAVLLIPGGSLIALAVWFFGRLWPRASAAHAPAVQPLMGREAALVYAAGISGLGAGSGDLSAPASRRAVETV